MKKWIASAIVVFLLMHDTVARAQSNSPNVIVDSSAQRVIDLYKKYKAVPQNISGYRVQLMSSSSRDEVLQAKSKFTQQFPAIPIYLIYQQPQFKLRAGDFTSKTDALSFLSVVQNDFSSAFVVPDKIVLGGK